MEVQLPSRDLVPVDRERQVRGTAAVMTWHETAVGLERVGMPASEQQQHRTLSGVERHDPICSKHRRCTEQALVERRGALQIVAIECGLENASQDGHDARV